MNIPEEIQNAAYKYALKNYSYNKDHHFQISKDAYEAGAMDFKEYWQGRCGLKLNMVVKCHTYMIGEVKSGNCGFHKIFFYGSG